MLRPPSSGGGDGGYGDGEGDDDDDHYLFHRTAQEMLDEEMLLASGGVVPALGGVYNHGRHQTRAESPGRQARTRLRVNQSGGAAAAGVEAAAKKKQQQRQQSGQQSGQHQQQQQRHSMAPDEAREGEELGSRLAYTGTAAKWAGPVGGRTRGYGTRELKSTTRRVVHGVAPREKFGDWKVRELAAADPFHAQPLARPAYETRALRVDHIKDVPNKPSPYPRFAVGQAVRAQARDRPSVWFDATVVAVRPGGDQGLLGGLGGDDDPAQALYDVKYEGYKSQPQQALGKKLPVSMLQGPASLRRVGR
jgi:hypothetical protein